MKRVSLTIAIILLLCCYANAQSAIDLGTARDGTYTNPGFGFSFKYPKDWAIHGEETNERIREVGKEKLVESGALSKPTVEVALNHTYNLLTLFRHPVGTPGITVNPAILVMAEKVAHAPGIINGKDFLLNLRVLLQKTGAKTLLEEPTEHDFGGSQFFRDDYAVEMAGMVITQAYFAKIINGYALVFVYIGEDQKSVEGMSKAMETFTALPPIRRGVPTTISPRHKPN